MNEQPRRNSAGRLFASLLILIAALLVFVFRQQLIDQYQFRTFTPSNEIKSLADTTTMTSYGRFMFYASHPSIEERATFNETCVQRGEKSAVLGCYVGMKIYVFNVTDERLKGIKEVTSAHEMLHAAYDRLSTSEKSRVNKLVEDQLASVKDQRILDLIQVYEKTEPGERANELHSILGTELANLSPDLESYYARYFTDRSKVVSLSKQYESVFTQITDQQNTLVAELNALSDQITEDSSKYNADTKALNNAIDTFNTRANNGQFSSQSEFDRQRQALLTQQAALQASRAALNDKISSYNTKRTELEKLNGQAEDLNRSINSQLTPVPSV